MFTAIFLSLIIAAWLLLGFMPWLVWSVASRGHSGLRMLPLCMFAGVVGGLAVPLLFRDDEWGLLFSAVAAVFTATVLMAARALRLKPVRPVTVTDEAT